MGQPEEALQSPGKICLLSKRNNNEEENTVGSDETCARDVTHEGKNVPGSSGEKVDNTPPGNCKLLSSVSDKGNADDGGGKPVLNERELCFQEQEHAIQSPLPHHHHPRLGSECCDTVKNNSQESGLSIGGDVSSSLSSSESFSGSEDISPKSSRKDPLTTKCSQAVVEGDTKGVAGRDCQDSIDGIETQQEKPDEKYDAYEFDGCKDDDDDDVGQDDDGDDQHVHQDDDKVGNGNSRCSGTSESVEISLGEDDIYSYKGNSTENCCSGCNREENLIAMKMMSTESGEEEMYEGEGTVEGSTRQNESSPHPFLSGSDEGKEGNQNGGNIWMFQSSQLSPASLTVADDDDLAQTQQQKDDQQNHQPHDSSGRPSREKKRVFGLSGFGCRFNLNKLFSSSFSASPRVVTAATHSSTERLNNQLNPYPSSQGPQSLALGSTALLSNVSKSSSESNILMCHNSLDNLTDDLPSSRSTDSSCLLPTGTVDDQVLDNHIHHAHHHQHVVDDESCCCCCYCCCCTSKGTCDHHPEQSRRCMGSGCLLHSNSSSRCSSSPATVGRRRPVENVDSAGKADDDGESGSMEETNNNNDQVDLHSHNNRFSGGNNSNSTEGSADSSASGNPNNAISFLSSSSTTPSSSAGVLRMGITGGENVPEEELEKVAACGSSSRCCNENGDPRCGRRNSCSCECGRNCAKRNDATPNHCGNGTKAADPGKASSSKENLPSSSSSSSSTSPSTSSSATASCSTTGNSGNNSESSGGGSCSDAVGGSSSSTTSPSSSSSSVPTNAPHGQKFKLLSDGDVQVCRVKHGKNLVDKVIGSKLLRRWETHHLYLNDACISSKTVSYASDYITFPFPSHIASSSFLTDVCSNEKLA